MSLGIDKCSLTGTVKTASEEDELSNLSFYINVLMYYRSYDQ